MSSDKRNSIKAKATGLIFSPFDVASARQVPFGIPHYVQCILHGLRGHLQTDFGTLNVRMTLRGGEGSGHDVINFY